MSVFVYRVPVGTAVIKSSVFLVFGRDIHGSSCFCFSLARLFYPLFWLSLFFSSFFCSFSCLVSSSSSCFSFRWLRARFRWLFGHKLHVVTRYAKFRLACASSARATCYLGYLLSLQLRVARRKASLFFHYVSIEKAIGMLQLCVQGRGYPLRDLAITRFSTHSELINRRVERNSRRGDFLDKVRS